MKRLIFILVCMVATIQLSAQKNWITNNFSAYLSAGKHSEYLGRAYDELNNLHEDERSVAYHVIEFYEMLSASNNGWLSLCHYGSVQSALELYPSSQRLADQLYLYAYNIGGKYYYCLYNQDSVNGVSVSLKMEKTSSSGEQVVITMSSGAPNYSI